MAQFLGRGAVQHPRLVPTATDFSFVPQCTQCACHCRAMRADEIREPLVRKRKRDGDAIRQNPPPAFGQMPKRQQQPVIDSLMVSDRQGDGERVGAPSPAVKQFQSKLRPRVHPHHKAMIKHGQAGRLQHNPANLRLNVRSLVVPAPGANHVARPDQFHAATAQHFNLSTDQPIDNQEATMMTVGLLRGGDIPLAGRQAPYPRLSLAPGPLTIRRRQEVPNLRVGIDDADQARGRAHLGHSSSQRPPSRPCFATGLTPRGSIAAQAARAADAIQTGAQITSRDGRRFGRSGSAEDCRDLYVRIRTFADVPPRWRSAPARS
jgi:hypothetical protein